MQTKPNRRPSLAQLKKRLERAGITQREVAEAAGVKDEHVCNVLAGRYTSANVVAAAVRLLASGSVKAS